MTKRTIIARNIEILTKETEPGKFVTTATNLATDTLLDSKAATNELDALTDYDAMITTHALPIQGRIHAANLHTGHHYTLVFLGDFGLPLALRFTFFSATPTTYAQYDDAVLIDLVPYRKSKHAHITLYGRSFILYDGWRELDKKTVCNTETRGSITIEHGKYLSFDEHYLDDIKAAWPDFIVAYDHDKVYRPDQPKQPEEKPVVEDRTIDPREITPGIMLIKDEETGNKLCVDMTPEMFASLYSENTEALTAEDKLIRALRRATVASIEHAEDDDGGTCNFDAPVLDYKSFGMTKDAAEQAIKSLGFACREWEGCLVIVCFLSGQGNRRTQMAEAFCRSMNSDGVPSGMYYQMD